MHFPPVSSLSLPAVAASTPQNPQVRDDVEVGVSSARDIPDDSKNSTDGVPLEQRFFEVSDMPELHDMSFNVLAEIDKVKQSLEKIAHELQVIGGMLPELCQRELLEANRPLSGEALPFSFKSDEKHSEAREKKSNRELSPNDVKLLTARYKSCQKMRGKLLLKVEHLYEKLQQCSDLSALPDELKLEILSYLSVKERVCFAFVCKWAYNFVNDQTFRPALENEKRSSFKRKQQWKAMCDNFQRSFPYGIPDAGIHVDRNPEFIALLHQSRFETHLEQWKNDSNRLVYEGLLVQPKNLFDDTVFQKRFLEFLENYQREPSLEDTSSASRAENTSSLSEILRRLWKWLNGDKKGQ